MPSPSLITKSTQWTTTYRSNNYHLITIIYMFMLIIQQCQIVVVYGATTTSSIGIEIKRSPELTIAPSGDEVLFECELNLIPEKLEWRFQALPTTLTKMNYIEENTPGYNITFKNKVSKLRIYVSDKTVGEYQCLAWFGASAVASVPAKLLLADISINDPLASGSDMGRRPPTQEPIQWDIPTGNSVMIKCGALFSNPDPVWNFYKDDRPFTPKVTQSPPGTFIMPNVSFRDTGTYWCSAVNSIVLNEVKLPQRVIVRVHEMPIAQPRFLTEPLRLISAKIGNTALLECPGVGNPVPIAIWSRPDASLPQYHKNLGYGLEIENVTKEDAGTYFCRLDNGVAPALDLKIDFQVLEAPTIIEGPKATLTNESDSLYLECQAGGFPKPEIYWMINGQNCKTDAVIEMSASKILIRSVEKRHAGIVQCFARNRVGEVTSWNLLQVNPKQISGEVMGPPLGKVPHSNKPNNGHSRKPPKKKNKQRSMIPPSKPNVTRLTDESVMVRWSVPSNDGLPIQFFKVQYRILSNIHKNVTRSQWMTSNEDIPQHVRSYEVDSLKPDHFYRFRIAAVYSNNDNHLGDASAKFLLQRGSQLGEAKSRLVAPVLQTIVAISETVIELKWSFPAKPPSPIDGFYAYYRPASTAGEYSKATVDGMKARNFRIGHLEPGTTYEFKLQSFTASAASDFSTILTGKTLKPPTLPPSIVPSVVMAPEASNAKSSLMTYGLPGIVGIVIIVLLCICIGVRKCRNSSRADDDMTDNKHHHPDRIPADGNGFPSVVTGGNGGGGGLGSPPIHKRNGMGPGGPRMTITTNPLDGGEKNRNVMELRFLPTTIGAGAGLGNGGGTTEINPVGVGGGGGDGRQYHSHSPTPPGIINTDHHHHNSHHHLPHNHTTIATTMNNNCPTPDPTRRTLERSIRNLHHHNNTAVPPTENHHHHHHHKNQTPPLPPSNGGGGGRRVRRTSGSGPAGNSPRIMRGPSTEYLQHGRSPMPVRAAMAGGGGGATGGGGGGGGNHKRGNRLGSRTENMSSGSLNSIEV